MTPFRSAWVLVVCGVLSAGDRACADLADLIRRVPDDANVLLVLNADAILQTEIARANNWHEKLASSFEHHEAYVPPNAHRVVTAAHIDALREPPRFQISLIDLKNPVSLTEKAQQHGTFCEQIEGLTCARTPWDAYAVQFSPNTVGLAMPGNRQATARWLKRLQTVQEPQLSPFLLKSAGYVTEGPQFLAAVDLKYMFSPRTVRGYLAQSETMLDNNGDMEAVAGVIDSLQGVTLGVTFADKAYGNLRVSFDTDPTPLIQFAKPLLLEVLASNDASLDDFAQWQVTVVGNSVNLKGTMSLKSLRRLFTLFDAPTSDISYSQGDMPQPGTPEQYTKAQATKKYYDELIEMLDDVRTPKGSTITSTGIWMDRYARKIDRLPILNVDQDLLDFSNYVASNLRGAANAYRKVGTKYAAQRQSNYGGGRSGSWGSGSGALFGYYGTSSNNAKQNMATRRKITSEAAEFRLATWQEIDDRTAQIRRTLTERYNTEF